MGRAGGRSEASHFPRTAPSDMRTSGRAVGPSLTVVPVPGCAPQARGTASLNPIFLTYKIETIILLLPCSAVTVQAEHCALWIRSACCLRNPLEQRGHMNRHLRRPEVSTGSGSHLKPSPRVGVFSHASEVTSRTQSLADSRTQRSPTLWKLYNMATEPINAS